MYLIHTSENVKGVCTINFMADWGKLSARIIGLGLEPYEGFEIVFLQQAAGKLYGHAERRWPCVWTIKEYSRRMFNKARLLTRPTLARRDAPSPKKGRSSETNPRFTVLGSDARMPLAGIFNILLRSCAKDQRQKLTQRGK